MFSDYFKDEVVDDRDIANLSADQIFQQKPFDVQANLPTSTFDSIQELQNVMLKKDDFHEGFYSFYVETEEDAEKEEEIKDEEEEVKREEADSNVNQFLENSYLTQTYLGGITVVGLYIMYRMLLKKK